MDYLKIKKNIFFKRDETNSDEEYIEFKVYHSKMDRANLIKLQIGIIGTFGFFFLCFLYGTIITAINLISGASKDYSVIVMNSTFFLIIILTIIWTRLKLKKIPKYEDIKITKKESSLQISGSNCIEPVSIDLKDIKGAWIYEECYNNILMFIFIQLSLKPGKKKIKDKSPSIFIPLNLSTSDKLKEIYYLTLLFIEENFEEISVGYDNDDLINTLKRIFI